MVRGRDREAELDDCESNAEPLIRATAARKELRSEW